MDLQYYDDNSGKWISLKAQNNTSINDNSTFTTPNYIIKKLIKEENGFIKYPGSDGPVILNEKIKLKKENSETGFFISNIELDNEEEGTIGLTSMYGGVETNNGNLVSNVSFENGNLKVEKTNVSGSVLNPISSGSTIPDDNTPGIFYIQIEERTQNEEDNTTEEDSTTEEDNNTSI